jgi:hypothetical protein
MLVNHQHCLSYGGEGLAVDMHLCPTPTNSMAAAAAPPTLLNSNLLHDPHSAPKHGLRLISGKKCTTSLHERPQCVHLQASASCAAAVLAPPWAAAAAHTRQAPAARQETPCAAPASHKTQQLAQTHLPLHTANCLAQAVQCWPSGGTVSLHCCVRGCCAANTHLLSAWINFALHNNLMARLQYSTALLGEQRGGGGRRCTGAAPGTALRDDDCS